MRFVSLALLLACAAPAAAEPLRFINGRMFIDARVNGMPSEALLDSGAEASLLDPILARQANLPAGEPIEIKGSGGVEKARVIEGVMLAAGPLTLADQPVVIMSLGDLSTRLLKHQTRFVLGRALFDAARIRVDIAASRWHVLAAGDRPVGRRLPLTAHAGIESLPVMINGREFQADVDFGNGSDVMVSADTAKALKLRVIGQEKGGGIGGGVLRDRVVLDRLVIAGRTFRKVPAAVDPLPNAGAVNVGTSILRSFVVTTDFPGRAIYLAPAFRER